MNTKYRHYFLELLAFIGSASFAYIIHLQLNQAGSNELLAHIIPLSILIMMFMPVFLYLESACSLHKQTITDYVTGLASRPAFVVACERAMAAPRSTKEDKIFLMSIELNKFELINETAGFQLSDRILQTVAKKLILLVHPHDVVSRMDRDRFSILLLGTTDHKLRDKLADQIIQSINDPISIDGEWIHIGARIGISSYPDSANTVVELLRCADVALACAKKMKRDIFKYEIAEDLHSMADLSIVGELKVAINDRDLVLFFQPKLNLKTGKITAVESLIRWQHPVKGLIPPNNFIPAAEEAGLIKHISQYVIREATSAYSKLVTAGYDLKVAVNVSPNDIIDPAMMTTIIKSIVSAEMPPEKFIIEVTETAIMSDPDAAFKILVALDSLGINISIDDFGTGHSSLLYLKNFPIKEVKLDKSFIIDIDQSIESYSIVKATIELAHILNANVVAEGVETQDIQILLGALGCDESQGYYTAKPMPLNELIMWLDAREKN